MRRRWTDAGWTSVGMCRHVQVFEDRSGEAADVPEDVRERIDALRRLRWGSWRALLSWRGSRHRHLDGSRPVF